MMTLVPMCSICGLELAKNPREWNNAQPVNDGICCNKCNNEVVVPMRIEQLEKQG